VVLLQKESMLVYITLALIFACGSPNSDANTSEIKKDSIVFKEAISDSSSNSLNEVEESTDTLMHEEPETKDDIDKKPVEKPSTEVKNPPKKDPVQPVEKTDVNKDKEDDQDEKVMEDTSQGKIKIQDQTAPPAEAATQVEHATWDQLLRAHVSNSGNVDYKALKSKEGQLDKYLALLSENPPQGGDSRAYVMSYWINAYNAFTVKKILENYPIKSIQNIAGGKVWDVRWIEIGGTKYSLNQIENDILRKDYKDARIHFAVNCAAVSCPPLLNEAFNESNLDRLLDQQTKSFIQNEKYNAITPSKIEVSKIFDWYGVDFGNVATYVNNYSPVTVNSDAKVKFKKYDWALNGK